MPSWLQIDAGLIFHHFDDLEILIKVICKSGECFTSSQKREDLPVLCNELNPQLQFSEDVIVKMLQSALEDCSKIAVEGQTVTVTSSIDLQNITLPFLWEFHLCPCSDMIEDLLHPIFSSMMLVIEQKQALVTLVKKKDKEIAEFRSLGLTLSKKSKLSAPFDSAHTLKNIHLPNMSTHDIISNKLFSEAFQQPLETKKTVQSNSRKIVPSGITFDDSFSQPECPVFTDSDVKMNDVSSEHVASNNLGGLINTKSEEVKCEEIDHEDETAVPSSSAHSAMPAKKRKKPRRL